MIRLERNHISNLGMKEYIEMYSAVFGNWDIEGNSPAEIYTVYDDLTYIGFMAGYPTAPGCWYLQRGGFLKEGQRNIKCLGIYREALRKLNEVWPNIRTHVNSKDLPALKICLNSGFEIIGMRSVHGQIEVEMIHFLEEGNG